MKIKLYESYTDKIKFINELDRQITEIEERLKTPERTVDDLIRHMQLLKQRRSV